jgi:hypothetical protein
MKNKVTILSTIVVLTLFCMSAFAQDNGKDIRENESIISTEVLPNGPQHGSITSNPNADEINRLSAQLDIARKNGDMQLKSQLEARINSLNGDVVISTPNTNGPQPVYQIVNQPGNTEGDMGLTAIQSYANWSVSTSTEKTTGRIWLVTAEYNAGGSDSVLFFSSIDNGVHWTLTGKFGYGVTGVHFTGNSFQSEALYDGTSGWIYTVGSLIYSGYTYSFVARIKADGTNLYYSYLYASGATLKQYWPRLTSDNLTYTTGTYVCIVNTQDTILGANNHTLSTKLTLITSPYVATPSLTPQNHNGNYGYYWYASAVSDSTALYSDIAYCDSAGANKLIVVSNFYNLSGGTINNVFIASTLNYGSTLPTVGYYITEANKNLYPSIAFTGGNLGTGIIVYTRFYGSGDWDSYYQKTTNFGNTWSNGYVESSSDTTVFADAKAIKGGNGNIKIATTNKSGSTYAKVYGTSFWNGTFGTNTLVAPLNMASQSYGIARAGYRLTTDSCLTVWCGYSGSQAYVTSGCTGTITGTGNPLNTPVTFKLEQNYPNPFNPTTRISFAIPKTGLVTLRVYDITGKEVATLVNEVKTQGNYSIDFNAANLSSGVYFYKINSEGFSDIKRMILVK